MGYQCAGFQKVKAKQHRIGCDGEYRGVQIVRYNHVVYSFKWADMSARETGWASSVVSQRYLKRMSVRFVSAIFPSVSVYFTFRLAAVIGFSHPYPQQE